MKITQKPSERCVGEKRGEERERERDTCVVDVQCNLIKTTDFVQYLILYNFTST